MNIITSTENKLIKELLALLNKKQRQSTGRFLLESIRSIEESLIYGYSPMRLIIREDVEIPEFLDKFSHLMTMVDHKVFNRLSTTEKSQGIIGVYPFLEYKLKDVLEKSRILFLDGIQDPGNLGTIIRSAAAFAIDGILIGPGTVDIYNDKVLRSTMGGIFALPIISIKTEELKLFKKHGFLIVGADLDGEDLHEFSFAQKTIVAIGNENSGLSEDFKKLSDNTVTINITSSMESLNAGVAAGIILYELNRI